MAIRLLNISPTQSTSRTHPSTAATSRRPTPEPRRSRAFHDGRIQRGSHSGDARLGQMEALRFHDQFPPTPSIVSPCWARPRRESRLVIQEVLAETYAGFRGQAVFPE